MRLTTLIFVVTLLTPITDIFAQNNDRTDVRASETDAVAVDSVVDYLDGIVVLCATQPQSVEFKNAWTTWVHQHHQPGMDIDAVINDVLTRARAYNATQGSRTITQKKSRVTTTEKMMHDTAMAVIHKIGS